MQKIHLGNEIKVWDDLWIPTILARPSTYIVPVVHPMMSVSELLIGEKIIWNTELLDNYVSREDIPLIQSLVISQGHQLDEYCWSYTKSGMHTIKLGYKVLQNTSNIQNLVLQNFKPLLGR